MDMLSSLATDTIHWGAILFLFGLLILVIVIGVMYWVDTHQTLHTIRRNYPVVGRFRYLLEHLGEFFRQYFFAMDREERPFDRAERSWAYRAAKKVDTTIAFGSTRSLETPGDIFFVNCAFPTLDEDASLPKEICIGEFTAKKPYRTSSVVNISGMSFGALSKPAVQALSKGARKAGIWMNTGEGGLSPYHLEGGCDLVFQIGTAKYGVRDEQGNLDDDKLAKVAAHEQVRMIEIKMSQGAKPGKGGMLPGAKVTEEIAYIRGIPKGRDSISPNGHKNIKSIEDLLEMIHHVRSLTGKPVGFKMVVGDLQFFEKLCDLVHKKGLAYCPDFITIDSSDGGTGAAPQPLMDYVGMQLRESLPKVVDIVTAYGLRKYIKIISSGKLVVPGKAAWALSAGADFIVSARGFLFSLGCIQALQCNKNTCPTGITTHNPDLQKGLQAQEKSERVANYADGLLHGIGLIAHSCGVKEPRELTREHVRIIENQSRSSLFSEENPLPTVRPEFINLVGFETPANTGKMENTVNS
ncbi:Glutamate synthase [NADPH] large chain [Marinomonas spartinae]|uniref:Glutamate synthase [NADPH] large chain n=1 Tax=Marinomonas spartinae TaxID=1792290 RepID=A0A1A8TNZ9_9GAMM|nr:FMN-binding glutamate synthase family protein [Marinomonas spartinae]SBS32742.1 Glutamate synthase [NADPH] large chain [Marinomonas spartinae]SBS35595.1 Glutamate synthase [NADPH] large chain [Marinomonas spartinae]